MGGLTKTPNEAHCNDEGILGRESRGSMEKELESKRLKQSDWLESF